MLYGVCRAAIGLLVVSMLVVVAEGADKTDRTKAASAGKKTTNVLSAESSRPLPKTNELPLTRSTPEKARQVNIVPPPSDSAPQAALTEDSLKQMLELMGYPVEVLKGDSTELRITTGSGWYVFFSFSPNQATLWQYGYFGKLKDPAQLAATDVLSLMETNNLFGYVRYISQWRYLSHERALENNGLSAMTIRQSIDGQAQKMNYISRDLGVAGWIEQQ